MNKTRHITFIVNPISGTQSKDELPQLIDEILDKERFEYEVVQTEYRGHAAELAKAGKNEAVDALVQNVQQFLTTNEQKLQELGAIEAVKSFPATVKETVEAVAASAESGAAAVKEQAEAAANQAVDDAKAAAEQKVEEAKDAAAQKVDEAAQKASEKVDEAAQKASQKADEAAADAAAKAKKKLGL